MLCICQAAPANAQTKALSKRVSVQLHDKNDRQTSGRKEHRTPNISNRCTTFHFSK